MQILIFMRKIISQTQTLSIQLNLEAIIAGIETKHSNFEVFEKSEEYKFKEDEPINFTKSI